ncbi:MAG: pGP6-D [Chlamydiales bacterium]|jgi:hypothetical protein|nr:pGP6-D [Chlamydiales bacterium]
MPHTHFLERQSTEIERIPLKEREYSRLVSILTTFSRIQPPENEEDLQELENITSELKGLIGGSVLLQGERIKKAQRLFFSYKEGAFKSWLLSLYGNRQTPYNMLQYYELHYDLPAAMRNILEQLPRKAAYILASRQAPLEDKIKILQRYKGEKQDDFIIIIRNTFPGSVYDQRRKNVKISTLNAMNKLCNTLEKATDNLGAEGAQKINELITRLNKYLEASNDSQEERQIL